MGIAVATPIQEVHALLYREELVKERRARDKREAEKNAPTEDWDDDTSRPGLEPDRLKIDEPMDEAVKKMFKAGKPPRE
jgi:hypothetical protein